MKCPHCLVEIHPMFTESTIYMGTGFNPTHGAYAMVCPSCEGTIVSLFHGTHDGHSFETRTTPWLVFPRAPSRAPVPAEVDVPDIVEDYNEACLVLIDSPKASAALSRRCLQGVLREKAGVKKGNLSDEIQQLLDSGKLPTHLAEGLDAVRNIGNFAAHPLKGRQSGEILPVEQGEAEWNLDILEQLMDFYFVQPARTKARRDALNKKLEDAGKPPMK